VKTRNFFNILACEGDPGGGLGDDGSAKKRVKGRDLVPMNHGVDRDNHCASRKKDNETAPTDSREKTGWEEEKSGFCLGFGQTRNVN